MLIISRKVKVQLKHTHTNSVQCMEKVWLIKLVKRGLWNFVLKVPCWTMLRGQVDQLGRSGWQWSNGDVNWNSQCYTLQDMVSILKIFKSSIENHLHQLGFVNHFDVWVHQKLRKKKKKKNLIIFPHEILYLNIMKTFCFFKTNCDGW